MLVNLIEEFRFFRFPEKSWHVMIILGGPKKMPIKTPIRKREFKTSETFTSYFSDYLHFCRVLQPNSKYI